jgi:Ca-activated chloride channel homolog
MFVSARRYPIAIAVALALVAGCAQDAGEVDPAVLAEAGDCIFVDLAVSSEKIELLLDLARTFNSASAAGEDDRVNESDGRCIFVRPAVKASGAAAALLAEGWDEDVEGPRPTVWSPA